MSDVAREIITDEMLTAAWQLVERLPAGFGRASGGDVRDRS